MLDSLAENSRVVIAGAGNLATCLCEALCAAGVVPQAVWSRSEASALQLAAKLGQRIRRHLRDKNPRGYQY